MKTQAIRLSVHPYPHFILTRWQYNLFAIPNVSQRGVAYLEAL
jgi:hypothetical protein